MKAKGLISSSLVGLALGLALVLAGCGGGSSASSPPPPSISSISPSSATAGQPGFTLTVNGSNFANGATVQWNGSNRATTFVSSTQLTAPILASDIAAPGSASVSVAEPGGSGRSSNSAPFTIQPANATPTISMLSPPSVLVGAPAFTLTVGGSNFVSGAVVQWNGSARPTTFVTSSQLTAAISASDVAMSDVVRVTVVNPGAFPSDSFSFFVNDPTPSITSLSPQNTLVGGQGFTLTVNGTNFVSGATVNWNGSPRTTTFVSSTQLTATISASDIAQAGTATVFVANRLSPQSNTLDFVINNPMPAISSLSPSSVMAGAAPLTLTVNGSSFVSGAGVQWNGSGRATQFLDSTKLTAAIPASDVAAQGTAQVTVVNPTPGGGPSSPSTFTINPLTSNPTPAISSLSDTSAPAGWPGFPLTVDGAGFVEATVAQWNGLNRATNVLSSALLKGAIPASDLTSAATAQVSVFTPSPGGGSSNLVTFTVKSVPPGTVGVIERSSVATDLTEADAGSGSPAISADGRFVVFASDADNLVPGDTNGGADIFLRDTCQGAPAGCTPSVVRVSVASDGSQANGPNSDPAISANGRYVAFTSSATNLVAQKTTNKLDVFLRDTCFGTSGACTPSTTLVSGGDADSRESFGRSLSADGRFVAFSTGFFGPCDPYGCFSDDFVAVVHDTCVGAPSGCTPSTTTASVASDGTLPNDTTIHPVPVISSDGRFVAFQSAASNLVPNDTNQAVDVFLRDTCAGAASGCTPSTVRVSVANDGSQAKGNSFNPSISANGRFVAFDTHASNLVANDTNGLRDVFVRDTCFGAPAGCSPSTTRVSVANDGSQGNGNSNDGSLSADGRVVAFTSDATNLVVGDTSPFPKIFLRDTCQGAPAGCTPSTIRLSVALDGTAADNQSAAPVLSGSGRYVVFSSLASNLAPGDTNQVSDIFVARTALP